jgi:hypothetical protein
MGYVQPKSAAVAALIALALPVAAAAQHKSVKEIRSDFFAPTYASPEEYCRNVDAVVVAVAAHGVTRRGTLATGSTAMTLMVMPVREVIRQDMSHAIGATVDVLMPTGEHELPDRIIRYRSSPLDDVKPGGVFLLFLKWNAPFNGFWLSDGPSSAYEIIDENSFRRSASISRLDSGIRRMPVSSLLARLKATDGCAR